MPMMTASELAEEFILASPLVCRSYAGANSHAGGKVWSQKSRQQFRSACLLVTKHFGLKSFVQLTHQDMVSFYRRLTELPVDHHIPLVDEQHTLDQIIDRARTAAPDGRYKRLAPPTIVRHLNNVRLLHTWLCSVFRMPRISWQRVLRWPSEHLRPDVCYLSVENIQTIFSLPVWTGAQSYRGTPQPGPHVWHSATYFVPPLLWYTGIARDILCACRVDDVLEVDGLWCLRVRNDAGDLAERGFGRDVPLHPELLRLGFLDYVDALRMSGHTLVFPELTRASGQSAADIFSSRCWRTMRQALPWWPPQLAIGAIRDAADRVLKDLEAFPEKQNDLFGVRGTSEADLRYTRITPPRHLLEIVTMIPVTTAHLAAHPIRLLPDAAIAEPKAREVPRLKDRRVQDRLLSSLVAVETTTVPALPVAKSRKAA